MTLVNEYIEKIGYTKTPIEYLQQNKGFIKEKDGKQQISTAAILLFGKNPQKFFPRARVRFIRYDGIEEKFGTEMNVIKDVVFEGTILKIINDSIAYLDTQTKEKTYLGRDGTFVTEEEYPKFVRQELIVNAVTHRAYSISGTEIQIKMFDNRIVVESPGKLPGMVKPDNIRYTHFSRNPKIAEYLKAYNFVKEYGEGVDRMCIELESAGLKIPEYHMNSFILQSIIYNDENPLIEQENPLIEQENPLIEQENPLIEQENPLIDSKKLSVETLELLIEHENYNEPTRNNILHIYKKIMGNQLFGTAEVKKILGCSETTARTIMVKMREDLNVVVAVTGKGKGKYRFSYEEEVPHRSE
jgi:ATP-dependent DNA helicase RecG